MTKSSPRNDRPAAYEVSEIAKPARNTPYAVGIHTRQTRAGVLNAALDGVGVTFSCRTTQMTDDVQWRDSHPSSSEAVAGAVTLGAVRSSAFACFRK